MIKEVLLTAVIAVSLGHLAAAEENIPEGSTNRREEARQHYQQQRQENKTFRQSIKDLTPAGKAKAAVPQREQQYQENVAFHREQHEKRMNHLRERLDKNTKLSATDKQDILNYAQQVYQDSYSHYNTQHKENIQTLERIADNPQISAEESRALIREQAQKQEEENRAFRQGRRADWQAHRQAWKDKQPTSTETR